MNGGTVTGGEGAVRMTSGTVFTFTGGTMSECTPFGRVVHVDEAGLVFGPGATGTACFAVVGASTLSGDLGAGHAVEVVGGLARVTTLQAATGFTNGGVIRVEGSDGGGVPGANLVVTSGTVTNTGTMEFVSAVGGATLQGDLINDGTVLVPGGSHTVSFTGVITNNGVVDAHELTVSTSGEILNTGMFSIGTGGLTIGNPTEVINSGTLSFHGTVTAVGSNFNNLTAGTIQGTGTLDISPGTLENAGVITPGSSTGTLAIVGDVELTETSSITLEIGDLTSVESDAIHVDGDLRLGGNLNVVLINDFMPNIGDDFVPVTYTSIEGSFEAVNLPALGEGLGWTVAAGPLGLALRVDVLTFAVNSAGDATDVNPGDDVCETAVANGLCTLRAALEESNADEALAYITFAIPGDGPHSIQPTSALPVVTAPVIIDGYTQPGAHPNTNGPGLGSNAVLMIELDGSNAGDGVNGLEIRGSGITVRGLAINRFSGGGDGIQVIAGDDNVIQGNFIGTNVTGTQAAGNDIGVLISADAKRNVIGTDGDGVNDVAERNVISGNRRSGVRIQRGGSSHETDDNVIAGNLIGTDASGAAALRNSAWGVLIRNGPKRNRIGTDGDGVADALERNVISSSRHTGVNIEGSDQNVVAGNFIGTDVTGGAALGNGAGGVLIRFGADNAIRDNVISGNGGDGVRIGGQAEPDVVLGTRNVVRGNVIGTDVAGTADLGNAGNGVSLARLTAKNTIGGTTPEAGNTIAFNGKAGVLVEDATSIANPILSNSIFSNGGLGIDLAPQGVTPNDAADADDGPNDLQNFPIVTSVVEVAESPSLHPDRVVTGTLASTPNTPFAIQLFATPVCDAASHGEGETLVARAAVTTDGQGAAEFTTDLTAPVERSAYLTATATDDNTGSTSEFSRCRPVGYTVALGGELLTTEVLASSPSGGPGFVLEADPGAGEQLAIVELCGVSPIKLTAGDRIAVGCASAHIAVEVGPIEVQLDDNTEAIVPVAATVTVEEVEEGELQIENNSPPETEPVQIAVGGTVVGELGAGESLDQATVQIVKAEVKRDDDDDDEGGDGGDDGKDEEGEDEFEIEGTFVVGAGSDGLEILAERVTVTLGPFAFDLVAGAFEHDDDDDEFKFEGELDGGGEVEVKIMGDGAFKIEVENVDLSDIDLTAPVTFGLGIGDDLGSAALAFDEDGEFKPMAVIAGGSAGLTVTPESLTVRRGEPARYIVTLGNVFGGRVVSLSCTDLPAWASCAFTPSTLTPGRDDNTAVLTVTSKGRGGRSDDRFGKRASRDPRVALWLGVLGIALGGLGLVPRRSRRGGRRLYIPFVLLLAVVALYTACDDDLMAPGRSATLAPVGTYTFGISAVAEPLAGPSAASNGAKAPSKPLQRSRTVTLVVD